MTKRDQKMDTMPEGEPLPVGTYVKIRYAGFPRAKIVEYRGPLGPGGMRIYRVRARMRPKPFVADIREDQIEAILPAPPKKDATPKPI
jgi:hypothetical protein